MRVCTARVAPAASLAFMICATMPGSGLFRVKQVDMGERPVNVEAEHARPRGSPA